jgi:sterol desaturase/sphingolipid hydroxylase (fatty acid hydroxylase superfamily)
MSDFLMSHEASIRLGAFLGVLAMMAGWERIAPRRALTVSRSLRWTNNLAIVVLNTLIVRAALPVAAVGMAGLARDSGWGLLNVFDLPFALSVIAAVVALDLAIYLQHVMFHAVPALWRLHRMHHADLDFDVTTGARFHPLEILLSMGIKLAVVAVLGPPVVAVILFEVLLNATAMFNHGNVRLPVRLDRALRWFLVTPDMHRVHHSILPGETNSNFGFNLPWWDYFLGTYRPRPEAGHLGMTIGIDRFRESKDLWLHRLLIQPFVGHVREPIRPGEMAGPKVPVPGSLHS